MQILSVRENNDIAEDALKYIQGIWASNQSLPVYRDCILHSLDSESPLPQWYLLYDENRIIGCCGLITNDFISRMDLWPWLCALYVEKTHRGHGYGALLINRVIKDTNQLGFQNLYLCTDHVGYYERYGFEYLAQGFHPWGESSRIYHQRIGFK